MGSEFEYALGSSLDSVDDRPAAEADQLARVRAKFESVRGQLPAPGTAQADGTLELLEARLDAMLRALELNFDPAAALPDDARIAMNAGDEIAAVYCYRRATGASLKEAQRLIRSLGATTPGSDLPH